MHSLRLPSCGRPELLQGTLFEVITPVAGVLSCRFGCMMPGLLRTNWSRTKICGWFKKTPPVMVIRTSHSG